MAPKVSFVYMGRGRVCAGMVKGGLFGVWKSNDDRWVTA